MRCQKESALLCDVGACCCGGAPNQRLQLAAQAPPAPALRAVLETQALAGRAGNHNPAHRFNISSLSATTSK